MAMNDRSLARPADAADAADAALDGRIAESLVIRGDVSGLSPKDRALFYVKLCAQLGLNPMTQPLQMLKLNGREILYPTRGATDQLASNHRINREIIEGPLVRDFAGTKLGYCVCRATHPNGRVETAVASLPVSGDIAMLPMKLETKAKRRATLSILGLGMLDEVEIETIPSREKSAAEPIDLALAGTATPLDYLRDDLASASTPEGIRESYRAHASAIAEMDEDGSAIRTARNACHDAVTSHGFGSTRADTDRILGKGTLPVAAQPAPVEREVEVPVAAEHPAVTALREALDVAKSLDGVVAVWRQAGGEVKSLEESDKKYAWDLAVEAAARIGATTREAAEVALRALLAGPKGDGPKGTRKVTTKPAADAQGSTAEGTASAGPQARAPIAESAPYAQSADQWAAHLAAKSSAYAVAGSWGKHSPAMRAAGASSYAKRLRAAVGRHMALSGLDESKCEAILLTAERDADDAAAVAAQAAATGKSEKTVRRIAREKTEQAQASEFAQKVAGWR